MKNLKTFTIVREKEGMITEYYHTTDGLFYNDNFERTLETEGYLIVTMNTDPNLFEGCEIRDNVRN